MPGGGFDPVWGTPPEPGTAKLAEGEFLAYHYTNTDEALSAILRDGVRLDPRERRPTEEAAAVWGSFERPQDGKRYVEFKVRYEDLYIGQPNGPEGMEGAAARGSNFTMAKGEIPVDRITTWSDQGIEDLRVWQRELADASVEWKKSVLNGAYDGVPAVDKARQVLAREFGSPGWAEKPSGVPDDVAVKSASIPRVDTDRLQRRADRLRREINDEGFVYPGGRMGFRHRAAELTRVESELVKRGVLEPEARRTSVVAALIELACRDASCAPPPVGTGGSKPGAEDLRRSLAHESVVELVEDTSEGARATQRQWMDVRGQMLGFNDLDAGNVVRMDREAEYEMLAEVVPVEPGFVRRGSDEAEALVARVKDVFPSASVGWFRDLDPKAVDAVLDGAELFPAEVREKVQAVALGYTENKSHVAAYGPHSGGFNAPYHSDATLWFGPKAVSPAVGSVRADGASVITTVGGYNRHRLVGVHEMGHVVHNMAAERAWKQEGRRVNLRADGDLPQGVPTTRYGSLDTGELVAETFAVAARDTFDGIEPLQQELIVSVLDRAGLRPEQLEFAVAEGREPYEVQFFGDSFEVEPDALRAAGCQSADCAPPPVGVGGSMPKGVVGWEQAAGQFHPIIDPESNVGKYLARQLDQRLGHMKMSSYPDVWGGSLPYRTFTGSMEGREWLSEQLHKGSSGEDALALMNLVHSTFRKGLPEGTTVVPVSRMVDIEHRGDPFAPNSYWHQGTANEERGGSGFTSWYLGRGERGSADLSPHGRGLQEGKDDGYRATWEGDVSVDDVFGQFGDTEMEVIVGRPGALKRVLEGKSVHVDAVAAAGCQDSSCAPPPVGTGGSKPDGGRVAELDSERIQEVEADLLWSYKEIWDDIPEVIERAYKIQTALNARTWEGAKVEDAYQAAIVVVDGEDEVIENYIPRSGWSQSLRSVLSATMKSPSPDPDVQALLVRMYEATQQAFQNNLVEQVELARSFDPVTDAADSMTGNEKASSIYGSRKDVDTVPSSGVTSWSAYTEEAGDWGTEYVEQRFPIEQVLMREGSIDGEFLVGESVERVREIVGR